MLIAGSIFIGQHLQFFCERSFGMLPVLIMHVDRTELVQNNSQLSVLSWCYCSPDRGTMIEAKLRFVIFCLIFICISEIIEPNERIRIGVSRWAFGSESIDNLYSPLVERFCALEFILHNQANCQSRKTGLHLLRLRTKFFCRRQSILVAEFRHNPLVIHLIGLAGINDRLPGFAFSI